MFRSRHINRRTADPVILRSYRDLRNERWTLDRLMPAYLGVVLYAFLVVMLAVFVSLSPLVIGILAAVGCIALVACFLLQAAWLPHGRRLIGFAFVIFVLALCVLAATYGDNVVMWLLRL